MTLICNIDEARRQRKLADLSDSEKKEIREYFGDKKFRLTREDPLISDTMHKYNISMMTIFKIFWENDHKKA